MAFKELDTSFAAEDLRVHALAPKYIYRDDSKANLHTIWAHGPLQNGLGRVGFPGLFGS